jgi:hypothetical protein
MMMMMMMTVVMMMMIYPGISKWIQIRTLFTEINLVHKCQSSKPPPIIPF